jgi:hypothetical protein
MQRPNMETVPRAYHAYVSHVRDLELLEALQTSGVQTVALIRSIVESKGEYRYQPGKWSIKELICHLMDAERIFCYRALRFARNDKTELKAFDENAFAPEANAQGRTLAELAGEMERLRATTLDLFASFTPAMLHRTGTANGNEFSVLHLGYAIAGHETHHRFVLQHRYLAQQ